MAESNTPEEKLKNQTPTLQYTLFADDYYNEELLYPNEKLGILKKKLEIVRSRVDVSDKLKKNLSPLRRPMNNAPLHEVYKNVINKDSFSILASILDKENNINSISSNENQNIKSTENDIKSVRNDNADIQKFNKPSNIEKTNQIDSQEINKNAKKSSNVKQDVIKKIKITSTKNTQSLKKKTNQRNKIVSIDKTK
ncbi:uncharacterized protein DDB_G0273453/DDB_G0273565-like [Rhopalosiphum maidis]|uniref:uncharacterized protein DDB_G0273453/DDB_G0273565-like n=1 Tax=Rhopalosiphum maidis TaxID=43146 RepID=UPI000EFF6191|nr:uncharacterized protein DDB_G0273453/DDB_G0273565-like [Rhopalosiphum maidis]